MDFLYIAGDHTNTTTINQVWEYFYYNDGLYPTAAQEMLSKTKLASVYEIMTQEKTAWMLM